MRQCNGCKIPLFLQLIAVSPTRLTSDFSDRQNHSLTHSLTWAFPSLLIFSLLVSLNNITKSLSLEVYGQRPEMRKILLICLFCLFCFLRGTGSAATAPAPAPGEAQTLSPHLLLSWEITVLSLILSVIQYRYP